MPVETLRSEVPECIPARMLTQYAYCPRLGYLEWVQGEFAENYETEEGRFFHRAVDKTNGAVPVPLDEHQLKATSVWMSAPKEQLTARLDLLEASDGSVTVVDYKRGKIPENTERSWESDRVHLCAQALVLRENGYPCTEGFIYYVSSKTRVPVVFSNQLIDKTRSLISEFKTVAETGVIPPPLEDSPKCIGCSLAGICLPDEINFLSGYRPAQSSTAEVVRRVVPARDDAVPLYVQRQGAYVSKSGELFNVQAQGERLGEARIFETSHVCIFGNVQVSTQALREMCNRNIPLTLFTNGGWFCGIAHGMSHKNVELRRAQYRAAEDLSKCLQAASTMISSKIRNCRTFLMRNYPALQKNNSNALMHLSQRAAEAGELESLLGIEGAAARAYFSEFGGMIKVRPSNEKRASWVFDFDGRNRRPPLDPVNAMLSYAYALLAKDFTVTSLAVGLDPFMGLYHKPRYGRPSLALDLMEEFRPIVADSVVLTVVNNNFLCPDDFIKRGPAVAFKDSARKKFIHAYERRLDTLISHPIFEYRISYRRVLEVQARLVARWLLGELSEYPSFRTR
jgi:CRISPR-associated protein Cas1